MKVLFIGNSHTFVHYVPARTAEFCKSYGQPIEPVMLTHPGMGLDWHLRQSQTYFNLLWGGYDAVILQHNAHPFPGKESLLEAGGTNGSDHAGGYENLSVHDLEREKQPGWASGYERSL